MSDTTERLLLALVSALMCLAVLIHLAGCAEHRSDPSPTTTHRIPED